MLRGRPCGELSFELIAFGLDRRLAWRRLDPYAAALLNRARDHDIACRAERGHEPIVCAAHELRDARHDVQAAQGRALLVRAAAACAKQHVLRCRRREQREHVVLDLRCARSCTVAASSLVRRLAGSLRVLRRHAAQQALELRNECLPRARPALRRLPRLAVDVVCRCHICEDVVRPAQRHVVRLRAQDEEREHVRLNRRAAAPVLVVPPARLQCAHTNTRGGMVPVLVRF